ncbi:hypothetical protein BHE74_00058308 [Ensete ventricosum]|nr:hypothetical protein BHE74_00058308 [Ensete ventricosum]RZR92462.1 hypothetical protein BHM03_00020754 [Ensete ventricosum]
MTCLSIGPGFERYSGISSKFARRFAEGIGKLTGNTPGDRRKKTGKLVARMSEATGLVRPWPRALLTALGLAKGYLATSSKLLAMAEISHVVKSHDRMGNLGG